MRGNRSNGIFVWFSLFISQTCRFTEQGNEALVDERFTNHSSSILEQVCCAFSRFTIFYRRLILGSDRLPGKDGISRIFGDGCPKSPTIFIGWDQ